MTMLVLHQAVPLTFYNKIAPMLKYINDIVKASNFNTVLYAVDINLHISGKKHEILEKNS